MAQSPLQADAYQVEPGAAGTRTVDRDPATGGLRFTDPDNTSGVTVAGLAGLQTVQSVLVVGKSGSGAQYNTIQAALDAVPASSSLTDPTLILVCPGVYSENLVIEKDGIWIRGLGGAIVDAAIADATVTIQKAVSTIPNWCRLQNLRVLNANAGAECVLLVGGAASDVGSVEIGIVDCELVASGVGTFQISAAAVNKIRVHGGTFEGSSVTSLVRVTNCHQVTLVSVDQVFNVQMDYDTANPIPNLVGSSYLLKNLTLKGDVQSTLNGAGGLTLGGLVSDSGAGNLTFDGDGAGVFRGSGSGFGSVTVNGSAPVTLSGTSHGAVVGAGTLAEDIQEGSVAFAASASEAVVFSVAQPDASYTVHPETELTEALSVTSKTAAGFTLGFSGAQTTTVNYKVLRRVQ
jgi:hypothetical protein